MLFDFESSSSLQVGKPATECNAVSYLYSRYLCLAGSFAESGLRYFSSVASKTIPNILRQ